METSVDYENISKKKALKRMKRNALALLGFAVLLFVIAVYFKIPMLQAFSEAAMVGGIADWLWWLCFVIHWESRFGILQLFRLRKMK
jgi:uncharacterized membrane protein (DUF485 family)